MFGKALFKLSAMVLSPFLLLAKSQVMKFLTIVPYFRFVFMLLFFYVVPVLKIIV